MICIDRCGWCIHYRGVIDGWKPACDAFPEGINYKRIDIPGQPCSGKIHFEIDPLRKDDYDQCWGDNWYAGPFDVKECYEKYITSGVPEVLIIDGKKYYRIIGKHRRYYDQNVRICLLLPVETFYVKDSSKLIHLVDDANNLIIIKEADSYGPQFGMNVPMWRAFACLVETENVDNEYQIGNYIRVIKDDERSLFFE